MTLFFDPSGPLLRYQNGFLDVRDLNPEIRTRWLMSRKELALLGLKCLLAAIRRRP
jgi:hypothetical protein